MLIDAVLWKEVSRRIRINLLTANSQQQQKKKKKKKSRSMGPNGTSPVAQTVKRLPTMGETWILSLSREDLLEKEMTIHSSTIAWKILWTEEPGRLQSMGLQRVRHD